MEAFLPLAVTMIVFWAAIVAECYATLRMRPWQNELERLIALVAWSFAVYQATSGRLIWALAWAVGGTIWYSFEVIRRRSRERSRQLAMEGL